MNGRFTVECLTAREVAEEYGFDIDAEFCYVVISEGFKIGGSNNPREDELPPRTAVVAQDIIPSGTFPPYQTSGAWVVEFIEDGEPQTRFLLATLDDALTVAKDYCHSNRG